SLWSRRLPGGKWRTYWRPGKTRALQAVALGPEGAVWLAAEDRGAMLLDRGSFRIFDRAAGLPTSWATDIAVAEDDTAFVATLRHGLLRVSRSGQSEPVPTLTNAWLWHVSTTKDANVFLGTQQGAALLTQHDQVEWLPDLPDPSVHVITRIEKALWIG